MAPGEREDPSATVVIVCYNHERYVEQCLQSALGQTYPNTRVLVIDDCSTDGSVDVISSFVDSSGRDVPVIVNEVNLGLCATLNRALESVSSDFVALIAADDWMAPQRVERQVHRLVELGEGYGAVYSDFCFVDGPEGSPRPESARAGVSCPEGDIFGQLVAQNVIPAPTVMLRRNVLDQVGGYDESLGAEDYDMWLRIARRYRWAFVDEPLVYYRLLDGSLSDDLGPAGFRATHVGALKKHLGASPDTDAVILPKLEQHVRWLYLQGRSPRQTARDLAPLARRHPSRRNLGYLSAATLGIPGRWLARRTSPAR